MKIAHSWILLSAILSIAIILLGPVDWTIKQDDLS